MADNKYINYDGNDYSKYYKAVRKALEEYKGSSTKEALDTINVIWEDTQTRDLTPDQMDNIKDMLEDFVAKKIIDAEIAKYPKGYRVNFNDGRVIEADILGRAYDRLMCDYYRKSDVQFEDAIGEELFYRWDDMRDICSREVERIFRSHLTEEELEIIDQYFEAPYYTLEDEFMERDLVFVDLDVGALMGEQKLKITIKDPRELGEDRKYLTDVFAGGDISALNKRISEMGHESQITYFETALYDILYQQGYSFTEYVQGYFVQKIPDSEVLGTVVNALREHPELTDVSAYIRMDGHDVKNIVNIIYNSTYPEGKDAQIALPEGTVIELSGRGTQSVYIELEKSFYIDKRQIADIEFIDRNDDSPYWEKTSEQTKVVNVDIPSKSFNNDDFEDIEYNAANSAAFYEDIDKGIEVIKKMGKANKFKGKEDHKLD